MAHEGSPPWASDLRASFGNLDSRFTSLDAELRGGMPPLRGDVNAAAARMDILEARLDAAGGDTDESTRGADDLSQRASRIIKLEGTGASIGHTLANTGKQLENMDRGADPDYNQGTTFVDPRGGRPLQLKLRRDLGLKRRRLFLAMGKIHNKAGTLLQSTQFQVGSNGLGGDINVLGTPQLVASDVSDGTFVGPWDHYWAMHAIRSARYRKYHMCTTAIRACPALATYFDAEAEVCSGLPQLREHKRPVHQQGFALSLSISAYQCFGLSKLQLTLQCYPPSPALMASNERAMQLLNAAPRHSFFQYMVTGLRSVGISIEFPCLRSIGHASQLRLLAKCKILRFTHLCGSTRADTLRCGRGTVVGWDDAEGRWRVVMDDGARKSLKPANIEPCDHAGAEFSAPEDEDASGSDSSPLVPQSRVSVCGIKAQPELNGQLGTVVEWSTERRRWKVLMDDGTGKLFKPANLRASQEDLGGGGFHPPTREHVEEEEEEEGFAQDHFVDGQLSAQAAAAHMGPGSEVLVVGLRARPELNGQRGTVVEWDGAELRWKVAMDDGSGKMFREANLTLCGSPVSFDPDTTRERDIRTSPATSTDRQALVPGTRVVISGIKAQPHLNGSQGVIVEWDEVEARWKVAMDDGSGKMFRPANLSACDSEQPTFQPGSGNPQGVDTEDAVQIFSAPGAGLEIAPGARVVISGIRAQPHLNGKHGTVVDWDGAEGRWKVVMDDGSGKMFKPTNLIACSFQPPATGLDIENPQAVEHEVLPAEPPGATEAIVPGARVVVLGVKAQPHLNGQRGSVVEWDGAEGRWKVLMDDGSGKMFRPANVTSLQHAAPAPAASESELAPAIGSSDASKLASKVDSSEDRHVIMPGSLVVVSGIRAEPHLNGQLGTAVEFDEIGNRWKVLMGDGCGKMFKPANLAAFDSTEAAPTVARADVTPLVLEPDIAQLSLSSKCVIEHTPQAGCPESTQAITAGSRVTVCGVRAQPHLNGQFGTAIEFDNAEGRWNVVMDDGSGKLLRPANLTVCGDAPPARDVAESAGSCPVGVPGIEPSAGSIGAAEVGPEITSGSRVIVSGIKDKPHLNGQIGTAIEFDKAECRWKVAMDNGDGKMFRPANISLCERMPTVPVPIFSEVTCAEEAGHGIVPGSRVTLAGLKTQPHMNGMSGTAVDFDEAEGRWKVAMDDGSGKLLRAANLVVTDRAPTTPAGSNLDHFGSRSVSNEYCSSEVGTGAPPAIVPGSRVVLSGIKAQPHLNGQFGRAVEFDVNEQRWKVAMDDGSGKLLKVTNLTVSDSAPAALAAAKSELAPASSPGDPQHLSESASAEPFETIAPGSRVVVSGISAQSHLNGQLGTAVEFDAGEGRWKVMMDDGSRKMFRPAHLAACEQGTRELSIGRRVRVTGLRSEAHLNGQLGTAIAWASAEERWKVVLDDGSGKLLRPANLEAVEAAQPPRAAAGTGEPEDTGGISVGSRVVATGVRNQPHLDGQAGTAIEWDEVEERWKVLAATRCWRPRTSGQSPRVPRRSSWTTAGGSCSGAAP
ncbi:unnamed protein product, partial [Prorocentrum cordatum]